MVSIMIISYLSVFIAKRSSAIARSALTWVQQGEATRRACSVKSSHPDQRDSVFTHSNEEITQGRWVKGRCLSTEHFLLWRALPYWEFSLQSAGTIQVKKKVRRVFLQVRVYLHVGARVSTISTNFIWDPCMLFSTSNKISFKIWSWMSGTCLIWRRQSDQEAWYSQVPSEWPKWFGLTKIVFWCNEALFDWK